MALRRDTTTKTLLTLIETLKGDLAILPYYFEAKKKSKDDKRKSSQKTKNKGPVSPKQDSGYFKKGYVREDDEDSEEASSDEEYNARRGRRGYGVSEDDADDFLREFGGLGTFIAATFLLYEIIGQIEGAGLFGQH